MSSSASSYRPWAQRAFASPWASDEKWLSESSFLRSPDDADIFGSRAWAGIALATIVAIVVTHHLTAYALIVFLLATRKLNQKLV